MKELFDLLATHVGGPIIHSVERSAHFVKIIDTKGNVYAVFPETGKIPNRTTIEALDAINEGRTRRFENTDALLQDLNGVEGVYRKTPNSISGRVTGKGGRRGGL